MKFFNPISAITKRLTKASTEVTKAIKAVESEQKGVRIEVVEEGLEVIVQKDLVQFYNSWRKEIGLVRDLGFMVNAKHSLVRALDLANKARRNLSNAKKQVFSNIANSGKRMVMLTRIQAARATGQGVRAGTAVAKGLMAPGLEPVQQRGFNYRGFAERLNKLSTLQKNQLQLISREVALQIRENQETAAASNPILKKNDQIKFKLTELRELIDAEGKALLDFKNRLMDEIRKEKMEIEEEQKGLRETIDALKGELGFAAIK